MSHLRIVGSEPPKPPRRRKGVRFSPRLLSDDEQKRAMQALRNLKAGFGTWSCMAAAMGIAKSSILVALRKKHVSVPLLYLAAKAAGRTIEDLLGGPVSADRCKVCGQMKRYAKALEARAV